MRVCIVFCAVMLLGHGDQMAAHLRQADTNNDGQVTLDEVDRQQHMQMMAASHIAQMADADRNRETTREEWNQWVAERERSASGEILLERRRHMDQPSEMQPLDLNGDGLVAEDDLQALFTATDKNNDNLLSEDEVVHMRREDGHMAIHHAIMQADANQDRTLTEAEWQAYAVSADLVDHFPPHLDQNGDGSLDLEELTALFHQLDRNGDGVLTIEDMPQEHEHHSRQH